MHNAPIQRRATTEEWSALILSHRARPHVASALEGGASLTKDGVRLSPPADYVTRRQIMHGPAVETVRAQLSDRDAEPFDGAPHVAPPAPAREAAPDLGALALRRAITRERYVAPRENLTDLSDLLLHSIGNAEESE